MVPAGRSERRFKWVIRLDTCPNWGLPNGNGSVVLLAPVEIYGRKRTTYSPDGHAGVDVVVVGPDGARDGLSAVPGAVEGRGEEQAREAPVVPAARETHARRISQPTRI